MVNISVDTRGLDKIERELRKFPNEIPKAKNAAINRVLAMLKTEAKRQAATAYTIKSSDFASFAHVKENSYVMVESRRLTLGRFKVKGTNRTGITAQIRKDGPMKAFKGIEVPGIRKPSVRAKVAFRGGDNVNGNIFMRTGRARLPIEALRTLSAAQMISRDDIAEHLTKYGAEQLDKRVAHEISRRLERLAKRVNK